MSIASYIDHTILKPGTTLPEIEKLCAEAVAFSFASVCVPPYFINEAKRLTKDSSVKVATVIGFPFGYSDYSAKLAEIKEAIKDGAHELDMVINIAALKNKDFTYLEKEVKAITENMEGSNTLLKLIIESGILTDDEIIACCNLYKNYPVHFMKTSTGYAEIGATVEAVQLMREHLPSHIQIKASGGIRTYKFAKSLLDAGATRLGCSASVAIAKGENEAGAGY
jgi:deoxyribose-phosphate aldolase